MMAVLGMSAGAIGTCMVVPLNEVDLAGDSAAVQAVARSCMFGSGYLSGVVMVLSCVAQ